MVRFSDSETSRPDPIALPAITVLTFIVLSLVWIAKVGASLEATRNYPPSSAGISSILQWIKRTGKPTVMRANVAEGFGLPNSDIPVLERGFRAEGERLTHVCAVGIGSAFENLVFFSNVNETDGSAMVWQTSNSGAVLSTVVFDGKVVENVPNAQFSAEFRSELKYFQRKARSANFPEDTHNSFLNAFMSGGWLAGICYPALVFTTFFIGLRYLQVRVPWQRAYIAVYAAYLGALAECFIIDTDHWRHFFLIIGTLWGMFAAAQIHIYRQQADQVL